MKKQIKSKVLYATCMVALTLYSCQDLDLHYSGGIYDDEQIQNTVEALPERINASVSGMYTILGTPYGFFGTASSRDDDFGYPCVALGQDLNSADMVNALSGYDWFSVALVWSDRTPNYANPQLRLGLFYKILYATKDVLSAIPDNTENTELKYKRGQAKALRAFSYLSLAPYFQFKYKGNEDKPSVPMIDEETNPNNNPRATLKELYLGEGGIIPDLTDAIADLKGFQRENKGVIDQQVAYGLRARAYLYMEEWALAAADADSAMIGYSPYSKNELSAPGFYDANDHNWIWALILPAELINGYNGGLPSWPSHLGSFSGQGYVAYAGIYRSINSLLYAKIPDTDVRKGWWLNENKTSPLLEGLVWTDPSTGVNYIGQDIPNAKITDIKEPMPAYTNVKFGQQAGVGSAYNQGDWCMMRAEEMILIKAEALAKAGKLSEGKNVLVDFVKNNRDEQYQCNAASIEEFENEIWFQRRIELWGEGFAMADVMRLNKNVVRYHPGEPTNVPEPYQFNIEAGNPWMLLRFVQKETTNNIGIVNNEGGTQPKQGDGANLKDGVTD